MSSGYTIPGTSFIKQARWQFSDINPYTSANKYILIPAPGAGYFINILSLIFVNISVVYNLSDIEVSIDPVIFQTYSTNNPTPAQIYINPSYGFYSSIFTDIENLPLVVFQTNDAEGHGIITATYSIEPLS